MNKTNLLLLLSFSLTSFLGCKKEPRTDIKVGIISDYRSVTQESKIKTMYDICTSWCDNNNVTYSFRKPNYDKDDNRETSLRILLDAGCNVIITLGSSFASAIDKVIEYYPYHKFIALDVSKDDMYNAHFNDFDFDYSNSKWDDYLLPSNLYALNYDLESTYYSLGYSFAKEGYKYINYVGNIDSVENRRIGYSFIQGANDFKKETNNELKIRYAYTNFNELDNDIVSRFNTWNGIGEYYEKKLYLCSGANAYKNALISATKKGIENVHIISSEYNYYDLLSDEQKSVYLGGIVNDYRKYIPSYLSDILNENKEISGVTKCSSEEGTPVSFITPSWPFKNTNKDEYNDIVKKVTEGKIEYNHSLYELPLNDEEVEFQGNLKA